MGRDKALLPWQGSNFLTAALEMLKPETQLVLVVAGKNADSLAPLVHSLGASLVVNPHPELGQFGSLQVGLQEVLNRGRDAAIVTLVDRPPASRETLTALRDRFDKVSLQGKWAVVPEYDGRHGHPIVIGREMIETFLKAPISYTARDVEHSKQDKIEYLPVTDAAVSANIDTPDDYARLQP